MSVTPRTVGGANAIYKVAIESAITASHNPDGADLGGVAPVAFVAAVAQDLGLADEKAVGAVRNGVTGACRTRLVDAILAKKTGERANPGCVRVLICSVAVNDHE